MAASNDNTPAQINLAEVAYKLHHDGENFIVEVIGRRLGEIKDQVKFTCETDTEAAHYLANHLLAHFDNMSSIAAGGHSNLLDILAEARSKQ